MKCRDMSLKNALGLVVRARPQSLPNPGFLRQLKELDQELHGTISLDVDELPKRGNERLAMFKFADDSQVVPADEAIDESSSDI